MFHRVKSEMTDEEMEATQTDAEATETTAQDGSVQRSLLAEEEKAATSEAKPQNVYQRVGSSAVRPGVRYSSKPATPSYKASTPVAPAKKTEDAETPAEKAAVSAKRATSSSQSSAVASATAADRRLTIGRGITMSGEIDSCDQLYVEGTV